MFSFWGTDWFHYLNQINSITAGWDTNLEEVYYRILDFCNYNYLAFRLIVWGGALVLVLLTFRRLSIPTDLATLLFGCIWVIYFSYARVSLAMAMVFYGASLIYKPKQGFGAGSYLIGLALIILSFFFHKSAVFGLAVFLIAFFFRNPTKGKTVTLLILIPIIVFLARYYLANFINLNFADDSSEIGEYVNSGQSYLTRDSSERGIGARLIQLLEVLPYYMLTVQVISVLSSDRRRLIPDDIKMFMSLLFVIVFVSSLFMFDLGANTSTVYIRFMRFAAIPSCIVLAYLLENNHSVWPKRTFKVSFFSAIIAITYVLYNAILHH